jgi:hypothetical protein
MTPICSKVRARRNIVSKAALRRATTELPIRERIVPEDVHAIPALVLMSEPIWGVDMLARIAIPTGRTCEASWSVSGASLGTRSGTLTGATFVDLDLEPYIAIGAQSWR